MLATRWRLRLETSKMRRSVRFDDWGETLFACGMFWKSLCVRLDGICRWENAAWRPIMYRVVNGYEILMWKFVRNVIRNRLVGTKAILVNQDAI